MALQTAELGVLLNHSQLLGALAGTYGFEYLPFYSDAAKKEGTSVVFFSPQSFIPRQGIIYGFKWYPKSGIYQHGLFEIPSVIHNRAFLTVSDRNHMSDLTASSGTILYNRKLRFDKWHVHQLLMQNPLTAGYLPDTAPLSTSKQIKNWLSRYKTVYLKPRSGSLGLGVIRLREFANSLQLARTANGNSLLFRISKDRLADVIAAIGARPYLIQEGIPLMQVSGQPVDFRVSVQKNEKGKWTVSGIVAKVGQKDSHATNLAVGGIALAARDVLDPVFGSAKADSIYEDLREAALRLAHQLEGLEACLADLGLDLAVTVDGSIKFVEMNGRDLRITFRDAKEEKMWRNTFYNPIRYGVHLLAKREEDDETSFSRPNIDHQAGN